MSMRSSRTRYGGVAIAIHWLSALLIVGLFATGLLAAGQVDPVGKLALVRFHVPLGAAVVLLTLLRIVWWWAVDRHPELPADQPGWQRTTARVVHVGLYVVMLGLGASGVATLVEGGALPAIIVGTTLPDLETVLPRIVHGVVSKVMLGLLALHVGAALWHQFVRRDHMLARMGVGA